MANQVIKKRRRRYGAPIGGLFVVLAAIGVITVVGICIRFTVSFLDNDREKQQFAELIRPVAMFNPTPFEDVTTVAMPELLRYSMWATILSEKRSSYEFEDSAELIIPASDFDVAAAKLFGPEVELVHQTFGEDFDTRYIYEEDEQVYIVPQAVQLLVYRPVVEDITKDGEFYRLNVGYIPPETAWTESGGPTPDKYMIYVVRKSADGYQIVKVQEPEAPIYQEGVQVLD